MMSTHQCTLLGFISFCRYRAEFFVSPCVKVAFRCFIADCLCSPPPPTPTYSTPAPSTSSTDQQPHSATPTPMEISAPSLTLTPSPTTTSPASAPTPAPAPKPPPKPKPRAVKTEEKLGDPVTKFQKLQISVCARLPSSFSEEEKDAVMTRLSRSLLSAWGQDIKL